MDKAHNGMSQAICNNRFDHLSRQFWGILLLCLFTLGPLSPRSGPLGCNCATYALARDRATEGLFSCLSSAAFPNRLRERKPRTQRLPLYLSRTKDYNCRRIFKRHSILNSRDSLLAIPCVLSTPYLISKKKNYECS